MRDILSRHESRVGVILPPCGKCNIEDPAEVERHTQIFSRMTELAHAFDTCLIRAFPFRRPGYQEYEPSHLDEYLELIVRNLMPMVRMAESEGVIICLECVGSTLARTSQEIRRVIDALGNPSCVGVIWEIDVASKAGELPSEGYQFARGLVRDVHVKPNTDHRIDPVGTSTDTYEQALNSLLADGYKGTATIEHWESTEGTLSGIRQLKALLSKMQ
jgi:sugar phosphate isomerase/epimerase